MQIQYLLSHKKNTSFLKDGSNDEIDGIFHQKATVCKCLLCGVTCTKAKAYHHVCYECPYSFGLFIILNGEDASTVYYMHTTPIKWGTIYLTELGTENIGLLLFENIYLSEEKVKKTKENESKSSKDTAKNYHVAKRPDGKWQVKFAGGEKAIKLFDTQAEAIAYAKKLAVNQDASISIHKKDGKMRKQKY